MIRGKEQMLKCSCLLCLFFFQAEDGIRDLTVTGVQTCALPICKIFAVLFVLLSFGYLYAETQQDKYRSGAINTRTGLLLVSNDPDNWYTLEIKGSDVRLTSTKPRVFNVDGMFLQVVSAKISKFLGEQEKRPADEKTILQAHRDWEAKYAQGSYTEKLVIESSWQKLDNGKDALLWKYTVSEGNKTNVKKQIYLT